MCIFSRMGFHVHTLIYNKLTMKWEKNNEDPKEKLYFPICTWQCNLNINLYNEFFNPESGILSEEKCFRHPLRKKSNVCTTFCGILFDRKYKKSKFAKNPKRLPAIVSRIMCCVWKLEKKNTHFLLYHFTMVILAEIHDIQSKCRTQTLK